MHAKKTPPPETAKITAPPGWPVMKFIKEKREFTNREQEAKNPFKGMDKQQVAKALWKISDMIFCSSPMKIAELEHLPYYWAAETFVAGKKLEDMNFKVTGMFIGGYSTYYSGIFNSCFEFFDGKKQVEFKLGCEITKDMTMKLQPNVIKFIREQLKKHAPDIQV